MGHEPRRRSECRSASRPRPLRLAEGRGHLPVGRNRRHHRASRSSARTRCIAATVATSRFRPAISRNLDDTSLLARLESLDSTRHSRMPHPPQWYIRDLHTNACGDFLLMSRKMWHTVRGFPLDNTVLSLDCNSLIMHAAAALGVARNLPAAFLPHLQGQPRAPVHQSHHPGLVALAVEARQVPGRAPLVAAADARAEACSTIPSARSAVSKAFSVPRSSATSSSAPSNGRTAPFPSWRSRRTGDWATNRSTKEYFAGPAGTRPAAQQSRERRAGRFPGRRPGHPVARADERTSQADARRRRPAVPRLPAG